MDRPEPRTRSPAANTEAETAGLKAELERLRSERERLIESEKMYRFSAEISGRLVWSTDPDGRVVGISRIFKSLTGAADEEALKAGWTDYVHPDDRPRILARWAECLRSGDPFEVEFRGLLPDGSTRTILSRAVAARDTEGRIVRWYGSSEDVHNSRLSEKARRDVEERYRLAVQATNDAVWDYDIVAGVIDWSDNSSSIFGSAAHPLGQTGIGWWEERIHPEDKSRVLDSLEEAIRGSETRWSATYRFLRDDGSYADMLDRGFIIRADDGTAVRAVGAMADLTARHRAEAELHRMQAELIHVSRVSAMGTMASTLAHELNQPLAAVSNFISGAKRLAPAPPKGPAGLLEALEAAESGARRAGEIVRRLRELVSRGTVSVRREHLPTLIAEAGVLAFVDAARLGLVHRLELDPAAQWVKADRIQVQQVLINLVRNAVEAMEQSAAREVVISTAPSTGGMVEIRVADSGPGIAVEHFDSLFSEFMTTKSGGMGIGLPICRTIVEAHGGKIRAENRAAGGALFSFTLPAATPH